MKDRLNYVNGNVNRNSAREKDVTNCNVLYRIEEKGIYGMNPSGGLETS